MAVIKSASATSMVKEAVVLDLSDVMTQARKIREAAERKVKRIVEQAQRDAEARNRTAQDDGFAQGKAEGYEAGLAEGKQTGADEARQATADALQRAEKAWLGAATQFNRQRDTLHREAQQAVLDLAVTLARKLTRRVIETDPTVIEKQFANAVSLLLDPAAVTVRVHADDKDALEGAMPRLLNETRQLEHVKIVADDTVDRGGCILDHGQGRIDARVSTQLDRILDFVAPQETKP